MNALPFTVRFFAGQDYKPEPSQHTTIYYRGYHFGHAWIVPSDYGQHAGKWVFNRGSVAIANQYWPPEYHHATLADLLAHLEATFPEVEV